MTTAYYLLLKKMQKSGGAPPSIQIDPRNYKSEEKENNVKKVLNSTMSPHPPLPDFSIEEIFAPS